MHRLQIDPALQTFYIQNITKTVKKALFFALC